tara:strand:+ start:987 stop:1211 length:225 start_codon:yes stop_codon:yes gene_type:complete
MQSSTVECNNCKEKGAVHWEIEPRGIEFLTCKMCGWDFYPRREWEVNNIKEAHDLPLPKLKDSSWYLRNRRRLT